MKAGLDLVIAMPAYNEEGAIAGFLREINEAFEGVPSHFVVINDCSTDKTARVLSGLVDAGFPLTVVSNPTNLGHGPSTLKALREALLMEPRFVLASDGDGHISGATLRELYGHALARGERAIIEGVRTQRTDPWFRKIASWATRTLVRRNSGIAPRDANTPFRIYPTELLKGVIDQIPSNHLTPNLMMSTIVRKKKIAFEEIPTTPLFREWTAENGSTWKQRFRALPSKRFLLFCWDATLQWVRPEKS